MRAIAKKRKKKEQEDLANANKLTEIQEINIIEKENDRKIEITSIPSPSSNRISSPLPNVVNKELNQIQKTQSKEDLTKKKKIKPLSTILSKQTSKLVSIKSFFSFRFIFISF